MDIRNNNFKELSRYSITLGLSGRRPLKLALIWAKKMHTEKLPVLTQLDL